MFSSGYPSSTRYWRTFSRWSPWSIIWPFFAVPPQAQKVFSFWARLARFVFLSFMPSSMVVGLPNLRVSSLMRILCCSFSISLQTHKSFGSPHVGQISAMTLKLKLPWWYIRFSNQSSIIGIYLIAWGSVCVRVF